VGMRKSHTIIPRACGVKQTKSKRCREDKYVGERVAEREFPQDIEGGLGHESTFRHQGASGIRGKQSSGFQWQFKQLARAEMIVRFEDLHNAITRGIESGSDVEYKTQHFFRYFLAMRPDSRRGQALLEIMARKRCSEFESSLLFRPRCSPL
jgi:hypothetical protein